MWNPLCLSSVLSGAADPKERTRRARSPPSTEEYAFSFLTPCESDAKSYGCDIFHSRTRVICDRVSTELTYTFAGPLSLKAKRCFHIGHHIGLHRSAHCALTPHWWRSRLPLIPSIHDWQLARLFLAVAGREKGPLARPTSPFSHRFSAAPWHHLLFPQYYTCTMRLK